MTDNEFDRLAGAWLDLMPREVPDRVIANVLQAVDATPQARRPRVPALWRPSHMNRFKYAAAVVAVAIVGLVGLSLAGGKPAPSIGASAPPSVAPSQAARVTQAPAPTAQLLAGVTAAADNAVLATGKRYAVPVFTPAFTFAGQDRWLVGRADASVVHVFVDTSGNQEDGQFTVMRVGQVLEPGGAFGGPAAAVPSDLVAWLRGRPDLTLDAPTAIKVGGIDGTLLRGSVRPEAVSPQGARLEIACEVGLPACSADNDLPSLVTLWAGAGSGFEIVALKVQGQQMLIALSADGWDSVRPQLEAFLAGIIFTPPGG